MNKYEWQITAELLYIFSCNFLLLYLIAMSLAGMDAQCLELLARSILEVIDLVLIALF